MKVKKINANGKEIRVIKFKKLSDAGVRHMVTTNDADDMLKGLVHRPPTINEMLKNHFGHDIVHFIRPLHGDEVLLVPPSVDDQNQEFRCDGVIHNFYLHPSKLRNWRPATIACTTGDCPFVIFSGDYLSPKDHRVLRTVGMVHSGLYSTTANIVGKAIAMVKNFGCPPSGLLIGLWSGICQKCYEVDERVWQKLLPYHHHFRPGRDRKHWQLNLRGIIRQQLVQAGINPMRISTSMFCSHCHRERNGNAVFFSHRRKELARNGVFVSGI